MLKKKAKGKKKLNAKEVERKNSFIYGFLLISRRWVFDVCCCEWRHAMFITRNGKKKSRLRCVSGVGFLFEDEDKNKKEQAKLSLFRLFPPAPKPATFLAPPSKVDGNVDCCSVSERSHSNPLGSQRRGKVDQSKGGTETWRGGKGSRREGGFNESKKRCFFFRWWFILVVVVPLD